MKDCVNKSELYRALFVEWLCMTIFIYTSIGCVISSGDAVITSQNNTFVARINMIAMAFGMSILVLVYCSGHLSGGHINPAVTWFLCLIGETSPVRAVLYTVVQVLGAVTASLLIWATTSGLSDNVIVGTPPFALGVNTLNPDITEFGGFLGEAMFTFFLCFTVLMCAVRGGGPSDGTPNLAPLAIGFTVFLAHVNLIPLTGCCINPARHFGPAFVLWCKTGVAWPSYSWIYYLGPFTGSIMATGAQYLFSNCFNGANEDIGDVSKFKQVKKTTGFHAQDSIRDFSATNDI